MRPLKAQIRLRIRIFWAGPKLDTWALSQTLLLPAENRLNPEKLQVSVRSAQLP